MNLRRRLLTLARGLFWVAPAAVADEGAVLPLVERAADWQLADPGRWKPHEWHNGAFYAGVMALAPVTFDPGSTEPYGVGALLLAGSERLCLAPK